jgi:hypothetical protein
MELLEKRNNRLIELCKIKHTFTKADKDKYREEIGEIPFAYVLMKEPKFFELVYKCIYNRIRDKLSYETIFEHLASHIVDAYLVHYYIDGIAEHEKVPEPDKKIIVKGDKIVSKPVKDDQAIEEPNSIKTLLTGKVEQPKVTTNAKTTVKKFAAKRGGKIV